MIDDPNCSLKLGPGWQQVAGSEPDLHSFRDGQRDISAALSCLTLDTPPEGLEPLARALVEFRLHAEAENARAMGREAAIYEPIVAPQSWGQSVAYYGHDGIGRQFSFSAAITRRCVITLYMSSGRLSEPELAQAMDEVLSSIVFDRTPLTPAE